MKKALRGDANTARGNFCKAEIKKIRRNADPLSGGAGRPKFNQLETVTTFTYKPSLVRIDARNFELSWKKFPHTQTQTYTPIHRQDRLQYTALQLARSVTSVTDIRTPADGWCRAYACFYA